MDELLVGRIRRLVCGLSASALAERGFHRVDVRACFFSALRANLRHPWKGGEERTPFARRAAAWLAGPVVSGLLTAVLTGLLVLARTSEVIFPNGRLWGEALRLVWSMGCLAALFFCIYALALPHVRPLRAAGPLCLGLAGAAYGVTALFTWFVSAVPRYNMVYGSLAGAVLFVLWLHYNAAVILWGGHFLRIWRQGHAPEKVGEMVPAETDAEGGRGCAWGMTSPGDRPARGVSFSKNVRGADAAWPGGGGFFRGAGGPGEEIAEEIL